MQNTRFSIKLSTGQIKIEKIDENTNAPIADAVFEIYSKELEEVIGTYTTDKDGKIFVENLKVGEYELREITKKGEYQIAENTNIFIQEGKTIEITIKSKKEQVIPDEKPPAPEKDPIDLNGEQDIPNKKPTVPEKEPTVPNKDSTTSSKKPNNLNEKEVKKLPKTGF